MDEWLREKRYYSDVSLPTRQRHAIIKDVSFLLKGDEGDKVLIICPIATTTNFQPALDKSSFLCF